MNLIKNFDFLANKPRLKINGQSNLKTSFGGGLSIITIILAIGISLYFFISYLMKYQIYTLVSKEPFDYFPKTYLGKNSFEIFLGMQAPDYSYYDPSGVLDISLTQLVQRTVNGTFLSEYRQVSLQKCSEIYTDEELNKRKLILPLDLFICVNFSENAFIQNHWAQENYSTLSFTFSICKNSTKNNNNCLPEAKIIDLVQSGFVSFFFSNNLVNPKNITDPVQYFIDENYQLLNYNGSTSVNYNINPIEFYDDKGDFFENMNLIKSFQTYPPIVFYEFKKSNVICNMRFDGASQGYKTYRTFPKIQDLFTKIGGTITSILFIIRLIYSFFQKGFYMNYFISIIFSNKNFKLKNETKYQEKLKQQQPKIHSVEIEPGQLSQNYFQSTILQQNQKKLTQNPIIEIKQKSIFKLSFILCFNSFFKKKIDIPGQKVIEILDQSLSVESITLKHFELEVMKYIVFKSDEREKLKFLLQDFASNKNMNSKFNSYLNKEYFKYENMVMEIPDLLEHERKKQIFNDN